MAACLAARPDLQPHCGDFSAVGEGDKQKITAKAVKARLKEIGGDLSYDDERVALEAYATLLEDQTDVKTRRKKAQEELDRKIDAKYPTLSEAVKEALEGIEGDTTGDSFTKGTVEVTPGGN